MTTGLLVGQNPAIQFTLVAQYSAQLGASWNPMHRRRLEMQSLHLLSWHCMTIQFTSEMGGNAQNARIVAGAHFMKTGTAWGPLQTVPADCGE